MKALICCYILLTLLMAGCKEENKAPLAASIQSLNLKKGAVIACGPETAAFGAVGFASGCSDKVKKDFDLAIALLHSFEYDESEKVFAKIIDEEPACAMAYWGAAMSNYHPLWAPPTPTELVKGAKAIAVAQSITGKTEREAAYIEALAVFYKDYDKADHRTRSLAFEDAMQKLYANYSTDKEAAIFYALALVASADPTDKAFVKQKKANEILNKIYPNQPNHPGIVHYIIHANDFPELAALALPEARRYASIAPSSAHAQHMPSHIFTRLGLWQECINSNQAAAASAVCYAQGTGVKGHWDEELHALDYQMYGYLQQGDNDSAKKTWDYLKSIDTVSPVNFKVAYAYAAMPARYVLENRMWKEAASLELFPSDFAWEKFPWQQAIVHYAKLLGSVHTGQLAAAKNELKTLNRLRDSLQVQKDTYKTNQVNIQIKSSEAWIAFKEGKTKEALELMMLSADMEDKTQKHPVTPGEVLPARELLGDMLLQMNQPAKALEAYASSLTQHNNRFNGLYGAAVAAEKMGDNEKAKLYFQQLISIASTKKTNRPEIEAAGSFLKGAKLIAGVR